MARRSVAAATFAALAESGVLFLPVRLTAVQVIGATSGPLATYPAFVVLFVAGTALATRSRRWAGMPTAAAAAAFVVGVVQGLAASPSNLTAAMFSVILAMLAALRVVTLTLRDWRNPVESSFGWGAVALLAEVFMASSAHAGWEPVLPVIVPVFFGASLASRGMSLSLAAAATSSSVAGAKSGPTGPPPRLSLGLLAMLAAVVAVGATLGLRNGPFELLGRIVLPVLGAVLVGVSVVLGLIGQGLANVFAWLHLDFAKGLRRVATNLTRFRGHLLSHPHAGGPASVLDRVVGGILFGLATMAIVRLIRRRRPQSDWSPARRVEGMGVRARGPLSRVRGQLRRRPRELPAQTVRRWYAEALLLLEEKGLAKPAAATPADYAGSVSVAFPGSRRGFDALTRAYEEVRYGAREFDRERLEGVRAEWDGAMSVIRASERLEEPEGAVAAEQEPAGPAGDAR